MSDCVCGKLRASNEKAKRNRDNWKAKAELLTTLAKQGCDKCIWHPSDVSLCSDEAGCGFAALREAVEK